MVSLDGSFLIFFCCEICGIIFFLYFRFLCSLKKNKINLGRLFLLIIVIVFFFLVIGYFIVNFVVVDLSVGILCIFFIVFYFEFKYWLFGYVFCKIIFMV